MVGEFFRAPQNTAFVIALVILAALSILAVIASLLGLGHGHGHDFDHDVNVDHGLDFDHDLHVDWSEGHFTSNLFEFLGITAMPASIFVVISSCSFFVTGFVIQWVTKASTGAFLPGWIAILPAVIVTIAFSRGIGKLFARAQLKLHTTAIHSNSFQGRIATITQGTAKYGLPAQAKFVDQHGQTHYVLVEPKDPTEVFTEGAPVALLERIGPKFLVISGKLEDILAMEEKTKSHEIIENS